MDDLIGRLVANAGVDRTAAEKAAGIVLQFLMKEGRTEKARALLQCASAEAAMDSDSSTSLRSPSMFAAIGGLMGVGSQMMAAGLSIDRIQTVTRELLSFARKTAGKDAVGEIVGAGPGLGQFA
jgi:hypothetical protein